MLNALKNFVSELVEGGAEPEMGSDALRLSYAALLVHAAAVDGAISAPERAKLKSLLMQRFDLDETGADELIEQAVDADQKAVDLYRFTRTLNDSLDDAGRLRMIEAMWTISYSDGLATDYENHLIWRVADLLGVSTEDRVALRQRVASASRAS